jgi:predicted DNA-binding transcriptional regulator YafY
MSSNKNALIRYKILDKCFRNPGKKYFIKDLIGEVESVLLELDQDSDGISRRQIFDDIAFMESKEGWNIDLERQRDGKKVYYRYSTTDFSINDMPLNEVEISQLQSAVDTLSQFKGMPQFDWIHELIPKLKQGISSKEVAPTIIEFDSNKYLKGIEHLGSLHNAIFYNKVLDITYKPYENDTPYHVVIHPYFLKQYNNRWFLFGYHPEKERYDWNLAIDRIVEIQESKSKYHKNKQIDWQEYFDDIIGVTNPDSRIVEQIVLHFYGKTAKYMETKPLHGSQKSKWVESNTLEVKLSLKINYELERLILSYADSVKIIKPLGLIKVIKDRLQKAATFY